ncbi:hypothetical protein OsJ_03878 [Oryza sativa Japonica Group]|uniref:Uncharacterized protein n=1 Tax=Oryza sativa subsp. japonica TaxID=39947 RepID=B9ETW4_ORYSJ|nr:hypothetical protein OsJ_03878 [Oryza sativa Japonica Group]
MAALRVPLRAILATPRAAGPRFLLPLHAHLLVSSLDIDRLAPSRPVFKL